MTYTNFTLDIDADGIALVTWDMPDRSMNVFTEEVMRELDAIVDKVASDAAIKGAVITSGKESFSGGADLASSAGTMTMNVLNAVAQFERDLLIERTQSGLKRAKSEGKTLGRPFTLSDEQKQGVRNDLATGMSVSAIARKFATSRQTIMRVRDEDSRSVRP